MREGGRYDGYDGREEEGEGETERRDRVEELPEVERLAHTVTRVTSQKPKKKICLVFIGICPNLEMATLLLLQLSTTTRCH